MVLADNPALQKDAFSEAAAKTLEQNVAAQG